MDGMVTAWRDAVNRFRPPLASAHVPGFFPNFYIVEVI
jgi:hypothetical protein